MEEESRGETDDEEGDEGGQEKSTGEGAAVEVRVRRPVQCTVQHCTFSARQFFSWSQNFTLQINLLNQISRQIELILTGAAGGKRGPLEG